jgi:hypothetical protein
VQAIKADIIFELSEFLNSGERLWPDTRIKECDVTADEFCCADDPPGYINP